MGMAQEQCECDERVLRAMWEPCANSVGACRK